MISVNWATDKTMSYLKFTFKWFKKGIQILYFSTQSWNVYKFGFSGFINKNGGGGGSILN